MEFGAGGGNENVLKPMIDEHFPSGPGVKNLPFHSGNVDSILGQETRSHRPRGNSACVPQLERSWDAEMKDLACCN